MSSAFRLHATHELELATYGPPGLPENVAIECLDCNEVLADADLTGSDADTAEYWLDHEIHGAIALTPPGGIACTCGAPLANPND